MTDKPESSGALDQRFALAAIAFILLLAVGLSPFASASPDGLEHVLEAKHIPVQESDPQHTPFQDYTVPSVSNESASTSLAGLLGAAFMLGLGYGLGKLLLRPKAAAPESTAQPS